MASLLGCGQLDPAPADEEAISAPPCDGPTCDDPPESPLDLDLGGPELGANPFAPDAPDRFEACEDPAFVDGTGLTEGLAKRALAHLETLSVDETMYAAQRLGVSACSDADDELCEVWEVRLDIAAIATATSATVHLASEAAFDPFRCEIDTCTGESSHCLDAPTGTTQVIGAQSSGAFVQQARQESPRTLELSLPFLASGIDDGLPAEHAEMRQVLEAACEIQTGLAWSEAFYAGPPVDDAFEVLGYYRSEVQEHPVGCFYADLSGGASADAAAGWLFSLTVEASSGAPVAATGAEIPGCDGDEIGLQPIDLAIPALTVRYLDQWLDVQAGLEPLGCPAARIPPQSRDAACGVEGEMGEILIATGEAEGFCQLVETAAYGQLATAISAGPVPESRLIELRDRAQGALAGALFAEGVVESWIECPNGATCSLADLTVQSSSVTWKDATADDAGITFLLEVGPSS